jgi:hypothetical protein
MPRYSFRLTGEVEATSEKAAIDGITAATMELENIEIEDGPDELPEVEEDDEDVSEVT